jgi:hypothetical protein
LRATSGRGLSPVRVARDRRGPDRFVSMAVDRIVSLEAIDIPAPPAGVIHPAINRS